MITSLCLTLSFVYKFENVDLKLLENHQSYGNDVEALPTYETIFLDTGH